MGDDYLSEDKEPSVLLLNNGLPTDGLVKICKDSHLALEIFSEAELRNKSFKKKDAELYLFPCKYAQRPEIFKIINPLSNVVFVDDGAKAVVSSDIKGKVQFYGGLELNLLQNPHYESTARLLLRHLATDNPLNMLLVIPPKKFGKEIQAYYKSKSKKLDSSQPEIKKVWATKRCVAKAVEKTHFERMYISAEYVNWMEDYLAESLNPQMWIFSSSQENKVWGLENLKACLPSKK